MHTVRNRRSLIRLSCALAAFTAVAPLAAQGVTLTRGTPKDVGMSPAVLEAVGSRNWEANLPMERNTMFRMASNTKPLISTSVAILAERGKLRYADPVRKYIPSFDNYKSGFITIDQLLSHTSGFRINTLFLEPYMSRSPEHPDAPTLQLEVARYGEVGAAVAPGTTYSYSNPGFNTLGALIEIAGGKPLDVFLRDEIYRPLGMVDSYNHEVAGKLDGKLSRMGAVYYTRKDGKWVAGWKPGDDAQVPFVRASGGLISTAWDYAIFLQTFLNGGSYGNITLLKPETVKLMTTVHTPPAPGNAGGYGYGWMLDGNGVYSHGGSDGTFAWVDPGRNIIGLVFTQTPRGANPTQKFMELVRLSVIEQSRTRP